MALAFCAALATSLLAPGLTAPAHAADCAFRNDCINLANFPAGPNINLADIIRRAHRFFDAEAKVYLVNSEAVRATLPYMLPRQLPFVGEHQIHIPEIYFFAVDHLRGDEHFVWHFIIGHEMAHVFQEQANLIGAMSDPLKNNSKVLVELHADYLAGFFMAREFRMRDRAIEDLFEELRKLPSGQRGTREYHGEPADRFIMATQGVLAAFNPNRLTVRQAAAAGIGCVFDLFDMRNGEKQFSEICRTG